MLKQRLITAAILIPLVVWALLALNSQIILVLFAIVAALAAWEWLSLINLNKPIKIITLAIMAGLLSLGIGFVSLTDSVFAISLIWLFIAIFVVIYAHKPLPERWLLLFRSPLFGSVMAVLVMLGFVISAFYIHQIPQHGAALLLYVIVSVWLADTGGYFAGKRLGKIPLAKAISPNKTWEGVAGAVVLSSLWAIIFYYLLDNLTWSLLTWLVFAWIVVAISIVGDLFESVFKRSFHIKDSGQLLPGHGGMLDRIDSLLAAIPVFAALLLSGA